MVTASRPWNRLAATEGRQAPLVGRAKEVTVPQTGQTAQHQRSALPLAPPLTFLLRHIQKTHKENAGGDRQAPTEVSRIQMVNDIRSERIVLVRLPARSERLGRQIEALHTRWKLYGGKMVSQTSVLPLW
jgi:hypothetical protein